MKPLRYDAVLFDLDGTLTDSQEGILNCVRYAFDQMGVPAPCEDTLRKFLGPPLMHSFTQYCGMNEQDALHATQLYRERFLPIGWRENKVYPGIRALLRALKAEGAYVAVATGKPRVPSEKLLDYFMLTPYIDRVIGPELNDLHADKADLIRCALPKTYRAAVMVGDRDTDIIGAREAGVDSVAARYGYGSKEELDGACAAHQAESVAALSKLLLGYEAAQPGYFITLEGLDGCGKSTQADAVARQLSDFGFDVVRSREPGGCPISEKIRDVVLDIANTGMTDVTEALLYAAARAQHVRQKILPAINEGKVMLCDRFIDSSVAFQGGGRRLGVETVQRINAPAVEGCLPDATIYLKLDHETALRRRASASALDRIESEESAFHARVEQAYDLLSAREPDRFITVDAGKPSEAITEDIMRALLARMQKAGVA